MEFPSPTPRRVRKPRWLDVRLVLGIVLVLAAVLAGAAVLARARHTETALAVTRDLSAGTTVQAADVQSVSVALTGAQRAGHVYLADPRAAVGKVLARPLAAGELVPAAAVGAAPRRTTVNVPFAGDAAPKLDRGERIEVWLSTPKCPSVVLLRDVAVQDVAAADDAEFSGGSGGQDAVLSLSSALAQRVVSALALHDATIRAGVLSGATESSDDPLPALTGCG